MTIKAWQCSGIDADDGSFLVFAETRNRARTAAFSVALWGHKSYAGITATRAREWDKYADSECVINSNDELPEGAEPFYDENGY